MTEESSSEVRKARAARRREKVLRGGKDRLAFITGQASSLPAVEVAPGPNPASGGSSRGENSGSSSVKHGGVGDDRAKGRLDKGGAEAGAGPSGRGRPAVAARAAAQPLPDASGRSQHHTPQPHFQQQQQQRWRLSRYVRALIPSMVATAYYLACVRTDNLPDAYVAKSALAWFAAFEAVLLGALGARPRNGGGMGAGLARAMVQHLLEGYKIHYAFQLYEDLQVFLFTLFR